MASPPKLITLGSQEWPREAGWLVPGEDRGVPGANCTDLEYQVVLRSGRDDGIVETPLGSNRGVRIDRMIRRSGLTPPVYWCAVWVGIVLADCGVPLPEGFPSCDRWLPYLSAKPRPGSAILYGVPGDARHIGIVTRYDRHITLTREGNRGYMGLRASGKNVNNGVCVDQAPLIRRDVLGYVHLATLVGGLR